MQLHPFFNREKVPKDLDSALNKKLMTDYRKSLNKKENYNQALHIYRAHLRKSSENAIKS